MTLPKKNRRKITIGNTQYFWLVGKRKFDFYKRDNVSTASVARIQFNIIIEVAEGKGKIVAEFRGLFSLCVPSLGFSNAQNIIITPAIISKVIKYAKDKHHWKPETSNEVKLENAQLIFPEAIWEGFEAIDLTYDANRIEEYLDGHIRIWP